jgi:predicted AAA+ superfamily ATPase
MYIRILKLEETAEDSLFLWGARQTGKSTLLKKLFPDARRYDLLESDEFERLFRSPALLREELKDANPRRLVIIDEVQKIPQLLDKSSTCTKPFTTGCCRDITRHKIRNAVCKPISAII